jgi:cysteine-rich repeat protein
MGYVKTGRMLALALAMIASPAFANFHLMKVVEVFPGTAASPNAQYIVLQMYFGGQNVLHDHSLTVFDASGTLVATLTFPSMPLALPNGATQDKVLISTTQAQTFFSLSADLLMGPVLPQAGGKVCFEAPDCISWGNYTGSPAGVGTPYSIASGLVSGQAAKRRLDIAGQPLVLDALDDTDNSANDFVTGLPSPGNNARNVGTIPPNTCPNGTIEGLEQCDDNNTIDTDACSNDCTIVINIFANGFE